MYSTQINNKSCLYLHTHISSPKDSQVHRCGAITVLNYYYYFFIQSQGRQFHQVRPRPHSSAPRNHGRVWFCKQAKQIQTDRLVWILTGRLSVQSERRSGRRGRGVTQWNEEQHRSPQSLTEVRIHVAIQDKSAGKLKKHKAGKIKIKHFYWRTLYDYSLRVSLNNSCCIKNLK